MNDLKLFKTESGDWITCSHLVRVLEQVKAPECRVLFMHTGMTFGAPNPELTRQGLLEALYAIVQELAVPTLCVPTFTFSFCNGEDYHVQNSRSRMGALNEYIRKLPGAVRSIDPLMSCALVGEDRDLVENLGKNSIGENCTFDKVHRRGADAKFLFFGTTVSDCYTYTHYVEERLGVPYRYNRPFTGRITDGERTWEDTYALFVRYQGVVPATDRKLELELLRRGLLRKIECGASSVSCLGEPDGYAMIQEHLEENAYAYIAADPRDRNTEFHARNMVAL